MRHNHHRKRTFALVPAFGGGLTARMFALAQILLSFTNLISTLWHLGRPDVETMQRDEIHDLRAENLRLKNKREFIRQGIDQNRVVELDQKIEFLELKIKREKWSQQNTGIDAPDLKAQNYPEPGDVRRRKFE